MKAFVALLLLLSACASKNVWHMQKVLSKLPDQHSMLISYHPKNEITGIGVELLTGSFGKRAILYVCARQIPSLPHAPHQANVIFLIDEEQHCYKAQKMEGGQKVLLPEEATKMLFEAVECNKGVTIVLDGYLSKI